MPVGRASRARRFLTAALAFAAGIAVGVAVSFLGSASRPAPPPLHAPSADGTVRPAPPPRVRPPQTARASTEDEAPSDTSERGVPSATVEVVYADTPADPSSDLAAAHRARRAKRVAAREEKAERCRDFLATLNLDLLTSEQQKLHAEYAEAVRARDAARHEMDDLRIRGEGIPAPLQQRLAEAESVIRADAAEERRALREAAARARGLGEEPIRDLLEDLERVDAAVSP